MKTWTKRLIGIGTAALVSFTAILFACRKSPVQGTAGTAFAETAASSALSPESRTVLEALQNSFRTISATLLPAVVEVDVTETRTAPASPFDRLPFFFFGWPDQDDDSDDRGGTNRRQRQYEQQGLGSGVIVRRIRNTFYVLTNDHVAGSATKISIRLNDGRRFDGTLVGSDERMDIALVSFESTDTTIPVAVLGDSDNVQTGDIVLAMGAPLGYSQSVTQGIISATGRSGRGIGNISDFIQTDAAINQGNSGGPLVNIYGEVIGINTWILSQSGGSQGLGFTIPINNIKNAIDDFIAKGKITYGWIGVSLVEVTDEYKKALAVGDEEGAFVVHELIDSPAQKAGMRAGDFVVELNGRAVRSVNQLVRDVGNLAAGNTARFVVIRNGKRQTVTVQVAERDEAVSSNNGKLWPGFIAVPLTDAVRTELKLEKNDRVSGIVVANVQERSPAAALRLQNNDIITAVNGTPVTGLTDFYAELAKATKSANFDVYSPTTGGTITTGTYRF
ncbi:MAG: Do family serine endopeptidase [Treponema sp.]|nr:Do family serine endopeptidase [Treponema sp.]